MQTTHWPNLTPYAEALERQQQAVEALLSGTGTEQAFFLEHEPCFTTGTSATASELLNPGNIPVIPTGRGGKTTYHGPGQRVVYIIRDLRKQQDLRAHIRALQSWIITSLASLGVQAHTTDDIGVWVHPDQPYLREANLSSARCSEAQAAEAKIAAIGIRVRKWVAFHGIALNVNPDLSAYSRIVPCGLTKPVTSLAALGANATMEQVDAALTRNLPLINAVAAP